MSQTLQEQAKELVEKFWIYAAANDKGSWQNAKQCALICVDEIEKAIDFDWMEIQNLDRQHNYYTQLRTEIEKL